MCIYHIRLQVYLLFTIMLIMQSCVSALISIHVEQNSVWVCVLVYNFLIYFQTFIKACWVTLYILIGLWWFIFINNHRFHTVYRICMLLLCSKLMRAEAWVSHEYHINMVTSRVTSSRIILGCCKGIGLNIWYHDLFKLSFWSFSMRVSLVIILERKYPPYLKYYGFI